MSKYIYQKQDIYCFLRLTSNQLYSSFYLFSTLLEVILKLK